MPKINPSGRRYHANRNQNINDLNPASYNPRKDLNPGDAEYEKLKKSILEFDYIDPTHLEPADRPGW